MRWRPVLAVGGACALSLFTLFNVFNGRQFIVPSLIAIALVLAGVELAQALRLPVFVGPLFSGLLVLAYLTVTDAEHGSHLFLIPGMRSFHTLGALARSGFSDIRNYATPVPATHGLVLLTVVGVAAVTLVAHLLAVTWGHPAAAGLPLLGLFTVGSAVSPHGVGAGGFVAVVFGYLLLLATDSRDRLVRWGRVVAGGSAETTGAPRPAASLRIGAVSVVAALVVPVVVPFLHAHRYSGGSGGFGPGNGTGGEVATTFNPILRLRSQLNTSSAQVLLKVHSTDPNPDYLQLTTLDTYTDDSWVASRDLQALPAARVSNGMPQPSLGGLTNYTVSDRITIVDKSLSVRWLPLPYPATNVSAKGDWRYDATFGTVFSAATTTSSVGSYRASAVHFAPTAGQLSAAAQRATSLPSDIQQFLQLPSNLPPIVSKLAHQVVSGKTTELAQAMALQNYFTGRQFHYSTQVADADGVDALVNFLTVTHTGFCVQYASAMAVMARTLNIPARVAVGFTAGTAQKGGTWVVTTHDAHAWPELYFPGAGWLRFEPTPRADGQAVTPTYAETAPATTGPGSTGSPGTGPAPAPSPVKGLPHQLLRIQALPGVHDRAAAAPAHHSTGTPGALLPVFLIVLIGAAIPGTVRLTLTRRRVRAPAGAALVEAAWAELSDRVVDYGYPWVASDTPRRAADRLAQSAGWGPAERRTLDRLVACVESARYARPGGSVADPRPELRRVLRMLGQSVGWQGRWRSRLLPRSTTRHIIDAGWRSVDRLSRRPAPARTG